MSSLHTFASKLHQRVAGRARKGDVYDDRIVFEPYTGKAGTFASACATADGTKFLGKKLLMTDTATPPGSGTQLTGMFVGNRNQFPQMLVTPIPPGVLDATIFDPLWPGLTVTVCIKFLKDCTFSAELLGEQVVP